MKNFSKKIITSFVSLILCLSIFTPAYAEDQGYYDLMFIKENSILLKYQASDSTTSGELEPVSGFDDEIDDLFIRYENSTKTFIICLNDDVVLDDYQILSSTNLEIVLTNNLTINTDDIPSIPISSNTYTFNSQANDFINEENTLDSNLFNIVGDEINDNILSSSNSFNEIPRSFRGAITVNGNLTIIGNKKFEVNFKYYNNPAVKTNEQLVMYVGMFCMCSKLTIGDGFDRPYIIVNEDTPENLVSSNKLINDLFMTVPFYAIGGFESNNAYININSYISGILSMGDFKVSNSELKIVRKFPDTYDFIPLIYCSIVLEGDNESSKPALFEKSVVNIIQEQKIIRTSQQFEAVHTLSSSAIVSYSDLNVNDCYFNIALSSGTSLSNTLVMNSFASTRSNTNEYNCEYIFNNSFVNLLGGVYFTQPEKLAFTGSTNFYISSLDNKPLESHSDNPSILSLDLNDEGTGLIEYNGNIEEYTSYPPYYWCSGFDYDQNDFEDAIASDDFFQSGKRTGEQFDNSNSGYYAWVCIQKPIIVRNDTGNSCFDIEDPKSFDSVIPELPGGVGLIGYFYENDYFVENNISYLGVYLREDMYAYSKYEDDNIVDPNSLSLVDEPFGNPNINKDGYMPYYVDENNHYFEQIGKDNFVRIYDLEKWKINPARGLVKNLNEENNIYEFTLTPNEIITLPINKTYEFKSEADFYEYASVFVENNDGFIEKVDRSNYEFKEGSTIITFKNEFLSNLKDGEHQILIVSKNGHAKSSFTIKGPDNPNPPYNPSNPGYVVPKTGIE